MKKRVLSILLLLAMSVSLLAGLALPASAETTITDAEIIEKALVYLNIKEGNCNSVNADDNGAVSIGMIQWHGCRALRLLNRILLAYLEKHTEQDAIALLGTKLYGEIKNASRSGAEWDNRVVSAEEKQQLVKFLGTDESKTEQGKQAREDLGDYIARGKVRGMSTPAMLFYYIDMENQYGATGASNLIAHAKQVTGLTSFVCLGELHNGLVDTAYWPRRISTYNYVTNTLKWEAPYFILFDGNGGTGTPTRGTPVDLNDTFTVAQNTFTNEGYAFEGWNVRRESDKAWYIDGIGWCSEGWIATKNYEKCLFSANQKLVADSKFLSSAGQYNAFTFVAVWAANGVQLELFNNYSGGNYILGSDFSAKINTQYLAADAANYTLSIDKQEICHGQNSLLLKAKNAGSPSDGVCFVTSLHGSTASNYYDESKTLTLRVWAKSKTEGQTLGVCWNGQSSGKTLTLTGEWKQYTLSLDKTAQDSANLILYPTVAGEVYLSCVQLRDGSEASAFHAENGGLYTSLAASYGKPYGKLPTPARTGYTFNGWYTAASGGKKITSDTTVEKGTRRLYAQWTRNGNCASNGHEWEWQKDVAATCTAGGYSQYTCANCTQIRQESTTLPLGHSYGTPTVTVKATCVTAGVSSRTCTRCGITDTQIVAPSGHTPSVESTVNAATCTQAGEKSIKCTVCGTKLSETELPALGHSWGEWVIDTPASATQDGEQHRVCTRCNEKESQIIACDAHTHQLTTQTVPATCAAGGYTHSFCGCGYEQRTAETAALGHAWSSTVVLYPASATRSGMSQRTCVRCGETELIRIAATGEATFAAFTDLPEQANWAYEGISFAVKNGLFNGMSGTSFQPRGTMTRAMLVTVLFRLAGEPGVSNVGNPFKDVLADKWYTDGILWAHNKGIVNGMTETEFAPDGKLTREQLATILYRYALYRGYDFSARSKTLTAYPDYSKISNYALDAVSWANAKEIIKGATDNGKEYLNPKGDATRAEVATMLMRFTQSCIK